MSTNIVWMLAGAALAGGAVAFAPISGELDPPLGMVEETTPSLADLEAKIDALGTNQDRAWEMLLIAPSTQDYVGNAVLVADGRVEVRWTSAFQAGFTLFDGSGGSVNTTGIPLNSDSAIHFNYNLDGGGVADHDPSQMQAGMVTEDGLYIGYAIFRTSGVIQVQYRVLD